jgi:hypothetical protein
MIVTACTGWVMIATIVFNARGDDHPPMSQVVAIPNYLSKEACETAVSVSDYARWHFACVRCPAK